MEMIKFQLYPYPFYCTQASLCFHNFSSVRRKATVCNYSYTHTHEHSERVWIDGRSSSLLGLILPKYATIVYMLPFSVNTL